MGNRRQVAAYKYTAGTEPPSHLAHIAIVEVETGSETPPRNMPLWDVTYYNPGDDVPGNLVQFGAWAYKVTGQLPAALRAVATWVTTIIGTLTGEGKLDFSKTDNSQWIAYCF